MSMLLQSTQVTGTEQLNAAVVAGLVAAFFGFILLAAIRKWLNTPGKFDRESCVIADRLTCRGEIFEYNGKLYSADKYLAMKKEAWQRKRPKQRTLEKALAKAKREYAISPDSPHSPFLRLDVLALEELV